MVVLNTYFACYRTPNRGFVDLYPWEAGITLLLCIFLKTKNSYSGINQTNDFINLQHLVRLARENSVSPVQNLITL